MNYIVYKTTNLINGKVYVGVHRTNPDIFDGYIGCGVSKKDQKKKELKGFPAAVRKYGYENFKRETLFIYPDSEEGMLNAYKKELEIVNIDWVKSPLNYNLTVGGKFTVYNNLKKEIAQYTIEGEFIRTWESTADACLTLGLKSIDLALSGKSKYCGNFQWRFYTGDNSNITPVLLKEKSVYLFDLQGNLLKCWKSLTEASKQFNNSESAKSAIHNNCINKVRQAFGYYWSFKTKFEFNPYNGCTAVACYTDDGQFVKSYTSLKEAAEEIGLKSSGNIIDCIKGKQKHCKNYRWRYFYGDTSNIEPLKNKIKILSGHNCNDYEIHLL